MTAGCARDLKFGAQPLDEGRVRIRVWAPAQQGVALVLEDDNTLPMQRDANGWFEVTAPCASGSAYCTNAWLATAGNQ